MAAPTLYVPGDTFGDIFPPSGPDGKFNVSFRQLWYDIAVPTNGTIDFTNLDGVESFPFPYFQDSVISGMAITLPESGDYLLLGIDSGTYQVDAQVITYGGGTLAIAAGDATYPRYDAVVADNAGTLSILSGTPAMVPVMPVPGVGQLLLAALLVEANANSAGGVTLISYINNVLLPPGINNGDVPQWNVATQRYTPGPFAGAVPTPTLPNTVLVSNGSAFIEDTTFQISSSQVSAGARSVQLTDLGTPPTPGNKIYAIGSNLFWDGLQLNLQGLPAGSNNGDILRYTGTTWAVAANLNVRNSSTGLYLGSATRTTQPANTVQITPVGATANSGGQNAIVGAQAGQSLTTGSGNAFFGFAAGAGALTATSNVAIGSISNVSSGTLQSVAVGAFATASHDSSVVLGYNMATTAPNQVLIRGFDYYLGAGVQSTSANVSLQPTGRTGADAAGYNMSLMAGRGTGNATPGTIRMFTWQPGASGTTLQSLQGTTLELAPTSGQLMAQNTGNGTQAYVRVTDAGRIFRRGLLNDLAVEMTVGGGGYTMPAGLSSLFVLAPSVDNAPFTLASAANMAGSSEIEIINNSLAYSLDVIAGSGTTILGGSFTLPFGQARKLRYNFNTAVWYVIGAASSGGGSIDAGTATSQVPIWDNILLKWAPSANTLLVEAGGNTNLAAANDLHLEASSGTIYIQAADDIVHIGSGPGAQGVIALGDVDFTGTAAAGMVKFDGTNFYGYDGSGWLRFDSAPVDAGSAPNQMLTWDGSTWAKTNSVFLDDANRELIVTSGDLTFVSDIDYGFLFQTSDSTGITSAFRLGGGSQFLSSNDNGAGVTSDMQHSTAWSFQYQDVPNSLSAIYNIDSAVQFSCALGTVSSSITLFPATGFRTEWNDSAGTAHYISLTNTNFNVNLTDGTNAADILADFNIIQHSITNGTDTATTALVPSDASFSIDAMLRLKKVNQNVTAGYAQPLGVSVFFLTNSGAPTAAFTLLANSQLQGGEVLFISNVDTTTAIEVTAGAGSQVELAASISLPNGNSRIYVYNKAATNWQQF